VPIGWVGRFGIYFRALVVKIFSCGTHYPVFSGDFLKIDRQKRQRHSAFTQTEGVTLELAALRELVRDSRESLLRLETFPEPLESVEPVLFWLNL
jgi:hypothetical protein